MIARIDQSAHIAKAIPITPRFNVIPNIIESIPLTMTVLKIDIIVVYLTSPVARNPLESGPENGKAIVLNSNQNKDQILSF